MNDLNPKTPPTDAPENVSQQLETLHRLTSTLLLGLVVTAGVLCVFLWRQNRYASADLDFARASDAAKLLPEYVRMEKPEAERFEAKLVEYGRTHPDFVQFLANYKLQLNTSLKAPPPAAPAAAPKGPPAPPK